MPIQVSNLPLQPRYKNPIKYSKVLTDENELDTVKIALNLLFILIIPNCLLTDIIQMELSGD